MSCTLTCPARGTARASLPRTVFFFFPRRDSFKACLETFPCDDICENICLLDRIRENGVDRNRGWNSTKEIVGKTSGGKLIIFFFCLQRKILGFDKWKILIFTGNLVFLILT